MGLAHINPVNPDKALRISRAKEYPKEVYYFIASFIFVVSVCNWSARYLGSNTKSSVPLENKETQDRPSTGRSSWRRLHVAALNLYRMVAFRCVVHPLPGFSLNLAEVFITAAYITIIFVWAMINSTFELPVWSMDTQADGFCLQLRRRKA